MVIRGTPVEEYFQKSLLGLCPLPATGVAGWDELRVDRCGIQSIHYCQWLADNLVIKHRRKGWRNSKSGLALMFILLDFISALCLERLLKCLWAVIVIGVWYCISPQLQFGKELLLFFRIAAASPS
jgi:hypothetical protein